MRLISLLFKESKALLWLGIPLVTSSVVEACPNFINNAMLAHLGADKLAAGALVSNAFASIMFIFYGVLSATSTLIAHSHGAGDKKTIGEIFRDAQFIALSISIPIMLLLWNGEYILQAIGQPPELVALARQYLHGLTWAVIPDFTSMILWQFFIGLGRPLITLAASLAYVPINIFANYVLMFGKFGFPALGMGGIGLGTALAFWAILIGLAAYLISQPEFRSYFYKDLLKQFNLHFKRLISLGTPIGIMWAIELFFFTLAAFYAGKVSMTVLAAQQVAIQCMLFGFVVVAGFGQAINVRIGHAWGAKDYARAMPVYISGLLLGSTYTFLLSLVFWIKPLWLIQIDFNIADPQNAAIIALAIQFFIALGVVQLCDNARYITFSALRGLKDTRFSALCSFIVFLIMMPGIGYLMVFHWHYSMVAFWWMCAVMIFGGFIAMYKRFRWLLRR
jgi:MATE family multidrug resistance protein